MKTEILHAICELLYNQNNNDCVKATESLCRLKITSIDVNEEQKLITVHTKRPGIFIGIHFNNYLEWENAFKNIGYNFDLKETVSDIEDHLVCYLAGNFDEKQ